MTLSLFYRSAVTVNGFRLLRHALLVSSPSVLETTITGNWQIMVPIIPTFVGSCSSLAISTSYSMILKTMQNLPRHILVTNEVRATKHLYVLRNIVHEQYCTKHWTRNKLYQTIDTTLYKITSLLLICWPYPLDPNFYLHLVLYLWNVNEDCYHTHSIWLCIKLRLWVLCERTTHAQFISYREHNFSSRTWEIRM